MKPANTRIQEIKDNVSKVIKGKDEVIGLLLTAIISSGHVLLEDIPGVGKTTLAKALAKSVGCEFRRIQFTPDLLPSDLTGIQYYNQKAGEFEFRKGPLFTNILLADEINRATPRTQSSLLECMEERQITVEGQTSRLDKPFFVIATQNPIESHGTFPLPEAQMDRFFMRLKIGYPGRPEEQSILEGLEQGDALEPLETVCSSADVLELQQMALKIHVEKDVAGFILDIVESTRKHDDILLGASPRGSIALYKAAQSYALLQGRGFVRPDDIIYLAPMVLAHRVLLKGMNRFRSLDAEEVVRSIVVKIPPPVERLVK